MQVMFNLKLTLVIGMLLFGFAISFLTNFQLGFFLVFFLLVSYLGAVRGKQNSSSVVKLTNHETFWAGIGVALATNFFVTGLWDFGTLYQPFVDNQVLAVGNDSSKYVPAAIWLMKLIFWLISVYYVFFLASKIESIFKKK